MGDALISWVGCLLVCGVSHGMGGGLETGRHILPNPSHVFPILAARAESAAFFYSLPRRVTNKILDSTRTQTHDRDCQGKKTLQEGLDQFQEWLDEEEREKKRQSEIERENKESEKKRREKKQREKKESLKKQREKKESEKKQREKKESEKKESEGKQREKTQWEKELKKLIEYGVLPAVPSLIPALASLHFSCDTNTTTRQTSSSIRCH